MRVPIGPAHVARHWPRQLLMIPKALDYTAHDLSWPRKNSLGAEIIRWVTLALTFAYTDATPGGSRRHLCVQAQKPEQMSAQISEMHFP